jgi:hypothetical protein
MNLALNIVAALCACYLLYVFGSGVITIIGAEYEWSRGRRIRGMRAVLMGFLMTFCAPLSVAVAASFIKAGMLSSRNGICVGAIVTAVIYWFALKTITRKLDAAEP